MSKYRNWVFTLNNYTSSEEISLKELRDTCTHIKYYIFGYEVGENGTPHLQGTVCFDTPFSLMRVKKIPGMERTHLERMKGTLEQSVKYCKKDNNWFEDGEPPAVKPGKRNDLIRVRETALKGGLRDVATNAMCLQEMKFAELYLTYHEQPRDWKPRVIWLYGRTGVGKSRKARYILNKEYPDLRVYVKSDGTKWWPGYDAHGAVILDDFRDSWMSVTEILSLADRYEKKVEFKGGFRQFIPKVMVITSCMSPRDCYKNTGEAIDQLLRRVDETEHMVYNWEPPHHDEGEVTIPWTPESKILAEIQMRRDQVWTAWEDSPLVDQGIDLLPPVLNFSP